MLRIVDTSGQMLLSYKEGKFDRDSWKKYMDDSVPGAASLCLNDMNECISAGFSMEKDFLPVLDRVFHDEERRNKAIRSFRQVTDGLDLKIKEKFGRSIDADVILYLGLCNGAGWVTGIGDRLTVLVGIEKLIELNWCDPVSMAGLIFHELGHVYHSQYGKYQLEIRTYSDRFIRQLFVEGVAMVFEQELIGDPFFYQQDRDGWQKWCRENLEYIKQSFQADLKTMNPENQRYFGDWVRFEEYGDVGYYLGTDLVRYLLRDESFDVVINYGIEDIRTGYKRYIGKGE
jgi:hypothetical protein